METIEETITQNVKKNRGIGAGGSNTNYYGKKFEEKTNNEIRLIQDNYNYTKNNYTKKSNKVYNFYLSKVFEDKTLIFLLQNGLKIYITPFNISNADFQ